MKSAAHIPESLWRPAIAGGIRWAVWQQVKGLRQWSLNFTVMMGREPSKNEQKQALESWARNVMGAVKLGTLSAEEILARVVIDEQSLTHYRQAVDNSGAVLALPHMGDWDLAGAWSCAMGMPISSVAERLSDAKFAYFTAVRRRVGMKIYAQSDPQVTTRLRHDLRNRRVVALVADRDFSRSGITVNWSTADGSRTVKMPPGPAYLARETGASLLPAVSFFDGDRMRLSVAEPVKVVEGPDGVAAMTQHVADLFSTYVRAHPTDWHMMQPFFFGVRA